MDHEQVMDILVQTIAQSDIPIGHLAIRAGVSKSAIHGITSGRTKWPRHTTLFSLMDVLGLQLTITKKRHLRSVA